MDQSFRVKAWIKFGVLPWWPCWIVLRYRAADKDTHVNYESMAEDLLVFLSGPTWRSYIGEPTSLRCLIDDLHKGRGRGKWRKASNVQLFLEHYAKNLDAVMKGDKWPHMRRYFFAECVSHICDLIHILFILAYSLPPTSYLDLHIS